jgi:hypothetical protein
MTMAMSAAVGFIRVGVDAGSPMQALAMLATLTKTDGNNTVTSNSVIIFKT